MTGNGIFYQALSLMNESRDNADGYIEYVPDIINKLLAENVEEINSSLLWFDKKPLDGPVQIETLDSTIEIEKVIQFDVKNLIANGLAQYLFLGDDEMSKATFFSSEYENYRRKMSRCVTTPIVGAEWYGRI